MSVTSTPIACVRRSDGQPGCGCPPKSSRAAKAAVVAAGTAAACTACCVLPFVLPAVIMANIGGVLAALDHAHGWMTWLGVLAVAGAWAWIVGQAVARRSRPATSTLAMMAVATFVIALAASWPVLKPVVFQAFGIAGKQVHKE